MLRVLIVDNTAAFAQWVYENVRQIRDCAVSEASNAATARDLAVREAPNVILLDLMLDDSLADAGGLQRYPGIDLGRQLRRLVPDAVIAMYSAAIDADAESKFEYERQCKLAGADVVVSRKLLHGAAPEQLDAMFKEWLSQRPRGVANRTVVFDETDLRTLACIEAAGRETLESLIDRALPQRNAHRVRALSGGFSGSMVLRIESESYGEPPSSNVLKVSRTFAVLDEELARRPESGSYFDSRAALPSSQGLIEANGWYAVRLPFVTYPTLERVLLDAETADVVETAVLTVARELLVPSASAAVPPDRVQSAAPPAQLRLNAQIAQEVIDGLEPIRASARMAGPDVTAWCDCVADFLQQAAVDAAVDLPQGQLVARLHGDFHARNILYGGVGHCVLIDFARHRFYPRLVDFASLHVDIMLRLFGRSSGASYDLREARRMLDDALTVFPFAPSPSGVAWQADALAGRAVGVLARALVDVTPQPSRFEYGSAVLFQLLRYLRFGSVAPTNRVVAAGLASHLVGALGLGHLGGP